MSKALDLLEYLAKNEIPAKVLPLTEVDADKNLSTTPRGWPGHPKRFQMTPMLGNEIKASWFFDDAETTLDALGQHPNVAKGIPMAPSPAKKWSSAPN